jgi:hypothetical protein
MIVALVSLFAALGGVGYAAVAIPANSVGSAQLKDSAVTNHKLANLSVGFEKIKPSSVGIKRINPTTVQARVSGTCASGAITTIDGRGKVTCASAPAAEFDSSSAAPVSLTSVGSATKPTSTTINSEPLAGGSSYIGFATPYVQVTSTTNNNQHVQVTCTLSTGPATTASQTRSVTVDVDSSLGEADASIPLVSTTPSSSTATTAGVACQSTFAGGATAPTVKVSDTLNVLQTASNKTAAPAGS